MPNLIGQTLLDQFRVDAFVASGGAGAVYQVWDLKRNVYLAMKVLHNDLVDDSSAFKSFQREARALQKLAHPNIVPFYGLFQTGDFAFLLEQFIDGPSLRDILRKQPNGLPVPEVLAYTKALCSALGYAHANSVIHCDIKPGNVMVDSGMRIYLADFGIARHADSATTTMAGAGTPAYMAPEQIRSAPVTPETDVYALGVLVFEMLTGQRPFRGDETASMGRGDTSGERIRYAHLTLPAPDPRSLNASIPPALAQIVMKCMAKAPADRYASTGELLNALGMLGIAPAARPQVPVPPPSVPRPQPQPQVKPRQPQQPVRRRSNLQPILWTGLVVFVVMVIAFGAMLFSSGIGPDPYQPDQEPPSPLQATDTPPVIDPPLAPDVPPTDTPVVMSIDTITPSLTPSITSSPSATPTATEDPSSSTIFTQYTYDLVFASDRGAPVGQSHPVIANSNDLTQYQEYENPPGYKQTIWPTFCGDQLAVEASASPNSGMKQWVHLYDEYGQPYAWDHPRNADLLGIPRCSPNGQYLAYTAMSGGYADIHVANVNSGKILYQPDFRSYGKLAVYTSWLGDSSSFVVEIVISSNETYIPTYGFPTSPYSSGRINLGTNGVLAKFSPDGSQAAFSCDEGQLCVSNLHSGSVNRIYQTTWNDKVTPEWIIKVSPVWSADGQWIYFASVEGGDWDILRIRPDGSGLKNMTEAWTSNEITPATR